MFVSGYYAPGYFTPEYWARPSDAVIIQQPVTSGGGGGVYRRSQWPKDAILTQDDEEILEILMTAFASGIFNQ